MVAKLQPVNLRRTQGLASSLNSLKSMLMRLELRGRKHFLKQRLLRSVKQANLRMKSEKNKKKRKEKQKKKTDASSHSKSELPYLVVKECKHKMNVFIYSNINFSHNLLLRFTSSDASSCFSLKKDKNIIVLYMTNIL